MDALRFRRERRDEGYAMPTAILLIMVCTALSVLMLGVITAQLKPTLFAAKNSRTIAAAEAGVDASLTVIRNARSIDPISTTELGDPRKLPCTVTGRLDGSSNYSYRATVRYYDLDPSGKTEDWRSANAKTCTPGNGLSASPMFALISSEGLGDGVPGLASQAGDRTLETIYTFQLTNDNVEGGAIYSFGVGFCLEASGTTSGSTVKYVAADVCRTDDPLRMWSWRKDYSIHLSITDTPGYTKMCIQGRPSSASSPVDATLRPCDGSTSQLFSWEGGAVWNVQNASKTGNSGYCLGTGSSSTAVASGVKLRVGACGSDAAWSSFDPDSRVGAGAASKDTNQIVNYLEFGRCADVTGEVITSSHMIVYPCKQDPSGTGNLLKWNHEWFYNEPADKKGSTGAQQVRVYYNKSRTSSNTYCLKTPSASANPAYVTFVLCTSGGADLNWSRTADAGAWKDSWTFKDRYGRCLGLGDKYNYAWSKMIVAPCNGESEQKWNAPPLQQSATLGDYREIHG
ncbi:hypothetical protein HF995_08795 [Sanguibacter hominis ATCC BAA-789]|uniref:Ricin-type beta-trefoil lectin domain protein n=1 Tax=Sanguibacter hominis ATCC BAA-789 TaxID=1312740 RepID=A0A9X5IRX0_9MICO|nr:hypothetical protein [Sanguibacter hominis]NKX93363.1 hypothetical protein [Sanguibacter hominis ATCC BAA-789]